MSEQAQEQVVLHVYSNEGDDFVVAASPEDAAAWSNTPEGGGLPRLGPENADGCGGDPEDWTLVPDDKMFTVHQDEHPQREGERKTCAEWAKENGRGFFASANY